MELDGSAAMDGKEIFEKIFSRLSPDVIFYHKLTGIAAFRKYGSKARTVRMVHDHDLCCPRKHKYFALNGRVCQSRAGWRCWADGAFLNRVNGSIGLVNIGEKFKEMRDNFELETLLVGSEFMKEELMQNGFPMQKIRILAPNVKTEDRPFIPVPEEKNILFVGQLIRGKGVDLLLRALKKLTCDYATFIVGTGNAEAKLKKMAEQAGLSGRVHFLGWRDHSEIAKLYLKARVVAVPSRWPEPFGMIGLEAMRFGRPVVAFHVGGIPDWLTHEGTGFLVPEQDIDGFAQALERLLMNTDLAQAMGRKGYEHVKSHFSFESYIAQLEQVLEGKAA